MNNAKDKQLVFIDESGDPGFAVDAGASPYFAIGVVIFKNMDEANAMMEAVNALKNKLKIKGELKFSKSDDKRRTAYLTAINTCAFSGKVLFVNKCAIFGHELKTKPKHFYNFILKQVLEKSNLYKAKVVLDGKVNKNLKQEIGTFLRQGSCGVMDFSMKDSKDDVLVQVADSITGAVTWDYKHATKNYTKLIDKNKLEVVNFENKSPFLSGQIDLR